MAKTSIIHREYNRKYDIRVRHRCRICFRDAALKGELPGVVKSSW